MTLHLCCFSWIVIHWYIFNLLLLYVDKLFKCHKRGLNNPKAIHKHHKIKYFAYTCAFSTSGLEAKHLPRHLSHITALLLCPRRLLTKPLGRAILEHCFSILSYLVCPHLSTLLSPSFYFIRPSQLWACSWFGPRNYQFHSTRHLALNCRFS